MNCVLAKRCKNCDIEGEYDLCSCTRKSRSGSITIQHPHESTSTSEAVTTNIVQVETNLQLNTDQHEEPTVVNESSAAQGREERRSPRRPHFRREGRLPQNRGQVSSDEPNVVFMFSVGEENQNRDWIPPTESESTVNNDNVEFTQPSDPTITKAAPPPYNTSNQYTTCGNGDENPAPNDDPPPYYYHES